MSKSQSELLFDEYLSFRKIDITLDQFLYLLNLYPSLLVCLSDGVLDKEEWESILRAAKSLAVSAETNEEQKRLEKLFQSEFKYLLDNIERWQKKFLNALENHVAERKQDKEFVLESMYLFANSANGISEAEKSKIQMLSDRLSLTF